MTDAARDDSAEIGRAERAGLELVFGGPLSLWVSLARIIGVKVDAAPSVDESLLTEAEHGAHVSVRWFSAGLAVTAVSMTAMVMWSPLQWHILRQIFDVTFPAIADAMTGSGVPWPIAMTCAGFALSSTGLVAGVLNALVFGGIPILLLRRCTAAAAPAVSVALVSQAGGLDGARLAAHPRVAYAVDRILSGPRRRPYLRRR